MLTIGSAFAGLRKNLVLLYDEGEATTIAHEVLLHLTGLGKLQRLSAKEQILERLAEDRYHELGATLLKGTPLQYAIGEALFLDRKFRVSPAVLIPRPETEELAQWILSEEHPKSLLDIGTGSGCIAVSLKLGFFDCESTAIDLSQDALEVAKKNARNLHADVQFLQSDFLNEEARASLGNFDLVVSNPPYIPATERPSLHTNVADHEPAVALFVPADDPLLFYRAIACFARAHINPKGAVYCELHQDHAEETSALFSAHGFTSVLLRKDMHGALRMLRAKL